MKNLKLLIIGEFDRMIKYKILQISFAVSLLWILILFLIGPEDAPAFIPLFIFMDVTMMSILMIGANLFYEKQENTLKPLLVTPSSLGAMIASKLIGSMVLGLQSVIVISIASYLLFDVAIQFLWLYAFALLIAFTHSMIGFSMSIYSRDFNGLLINMMIYMFFFAFPTIFYALRILEGVWETLLMFSPTHVSLLIIEYGVGYDHSVWMLVVGSLYLLIIGIVLAKVIVFKNYMKDAVRD